MSGNIHNAAFTHWSPAKVQRLLDEGVDINEKNQQGSPALHRAIKKEKWKAVKLLLSRGAAIDIIDNKRRTPLHLAVNRNNCKLCEELIKKGADVNCVNFKGKTPLHMAAKRVRNDICKVLLDAKANVNCVDKYGETPLHLATLAENNYELIKTLLRAGADVDAVNVTKKTPLHLAVMSEGSDRASVISLLKEGASLDAVDGDERTPLHLVTELDIAECLLSQGAQPHARDSSGITPFDKIIRNEEMTKLMIKISVVNEHNRQCDINLNDESIMNILGERLPELKRFKEDCIKEIDKIKEDKIASFSLFSVVSDSPDPVFASMHFETEMRIVEAENYNKYPIYMSLLRLRFEMGVQKNL